MNININEVTSCGVYGCVEHIANIRHDSTDYAETVQGLYSLKNTTLYIFGRDTIDEFLTGQCAETKNDPSKGGLFCKSLLTAPDPSEDRIYLWRNNDFIYNSSMLEYYEYAIRYHVYSRDGLTGHVPYTELIERGDDIYINNHKGVDPS